MSWQSHELQENLSVQNIFSIKNRIQVVIKYPSQNMKLPLSSGTFQNSELAKLIYSLSKKKEQ